MNDYHNEIARIYRQSRDSVGMSQNELAEKLNVSKKSIQNWESGANSPTLDMTIKWFQALGVPMYPYVMQVLHPQAEGISPQSDNSACKDLLLQYVQELPNDECRKLLYAFYANHGSSPRGILEMITAYLHTPLFARFSVAQSIVTNYRVCTAKGFINNPEHVKPDIELLEKCTKKSFEAILDGKNSYV